MQEKLDFKKPTTIQSYVWPVSLCGQDIVGVAKTGSGKTLAYMLPMAMLCIYNDKINGETIATQQRTNKPYVLVMAPTRELVFQIYRETSR